MSHAGSGYPVRTQSARMSGTLQPSADGMSAKGIRSHLQANQAPRRAPSKFVGRSSAAKLARRRRGQAWPPWVDTIASTASRLNEAGFWRGGNLTKLSISAATVACMR
jgi:hypothetical protein